ncbi:MAG: hypothetical protein Q9157_008619, partial [Trypethelium eluteriae]
AQRVPQLVTDYADPRDPYRLSILTASMSSRQGAPRSSEKGKSSIHIIRPATHPTRNRRLNTIPSEEKECTLGNKGTMFWTELCKVLVDAPEYVGPFPKLFEVVVHAIDWFISEWSHSETGGFVVVEVEVNILGTGVVVVLLEDGAVVVEFAESKVEAEVDARLMRGEVEDGPQRDAGLIQKLVGKLLGSVEGSKTDVSSMLAPAADTVLPACECATILLPTVTVLVTVEKRELVQVKSWIPAVLVG